MSIHEDHNDEDRSRSAWVASIEAKQRNTVWPDILRNGRAADAFLWNGLPNPSKVQRAGAAVFGLFFFMAGVTFLSMAWEDQSVFEGMFACFWLFIGVRVLRNAFPRRRADEHRSNSVDSQE